MENGIRTQFSKYSVSETIDRLEKIFQQKGIKLFCVIDHSGEAEAIGLEMPPTKVLIFGNAKAGTPLMKAAPSTALDLPLKILVSDSGQGTALLTWNDAAWLRHRHGFPQELESNIAAAGVFAHLLGQS